MSDFNLIPTRYLKQLQFQQDITRFLWVLLLLVALIGAASWVLQLQRTTFQQQIAALNKEQMRLKAQDMELELLQSTSQQLAQDKAVLEQLRGRVTPKHLFLAFDKALSKEIWFSQWRFSRNLVETTRIERDQRHTDKQPTWQVESRMTVQGYAKSHASLATFMRQLSAQPTIDKVSLLDSRTNPQSKLGVVNFEMTMLVHDESGRTDAD